jgi:hypothetical protein
MYIKIIHTCGGTLDSKRWHKFREGEVYQEGVDIRQVQARRLITCGHAVKLEPRFV